MIDSILGSNNYQIAKKLLDVADLKHQAISSNLANIETPGYRRIDIDANFETKLKQATKSNNIDSIGDLKVSLAIDQSVKSVDPDGNNVKLDSELLAMNKNAMTYEFLTQYLSSSIKRINGVIEGKIT